MGRIQQTETVVEKGRWVMGRTMADRQDGRRLMGRMDDG